MGVRPFEVRVPKHLNCRREWLTCTSQGVRFPVIVGIPFEGMANHQAYSLSTGRNKLFSRMSRTSLPCQRWGRIFVVAKTARPGSQPTANSFASRDLEESVLCNQG